MSAKDAKFSLREAEAQKKRSLALAYLEKNGCGPSEQEVKIAKVGLVAAMSQKSKSASRDNTLSILHKRKAKEVEAAYKTDKHVAVDGDEVASKRKENSPTVRDDTPLPLNWKAIIDKKSGQLYYWNKITNETSWECPQGEVIELKKEKERVLPSGWREVLHPATKQTYYVHTATDKKTWTFPTAEQIPENKK